MFSRMQASATTPNPTCKVRRSATHMRAIVVGAALLTSTTVHGAPRAEVDMCGDDLDQRSCYANEYKHADVDLNATYSRLIESLGRNEPAITLLRQSERAWVTYRDKYCAFEASGTEGGSIQSSVTATCLISITRARANELDFQVKCQEGDVACVR